jgi:pimeloyl-ACP methyl ester carboxylesterase
MLYSKIEGAGTPLLILHGYLGMSDNWKTLGAQFANEGFEVHLLDLRNHGRSFHSDEFNYRVMVQDVLDYCKDKNLKKVNLLGHSMGGKVAMFLSVNHPNIVEKLVVADIGPKLYKAHHQQIFKGLNAIDFGKKHSRLEVELILKNYIEEHDTIQFLMKSLYWKETGQLDFRFNLKAFNLNEDEIGKPLLENDIFDKATLFVRGGNSSYIKDKDFEGILKHFPQAKIETVPSTGHWLHAENPKLFLELVMAFLQ